MLSNIAKELEILYHKGYILNEIKDEMKQIKEIADSIFEKAGKVTIKKVKVK